MVNLSKKYGELFKEAQQDARDNFEETSAVLQEREQELKQDREYLADLRQKQKSSHKSFWSVLKDLYKLAIVTKPAPEEVLKAIAPCMEYANSTQLIPQAVETVKETNLLCQEAKEIYDRSEKELQKITKLLEEDVK